MFYHTTNKTEESWSRTDLEKLKPSSDSSAIIERINKVNTEGMSYETAVDVIKAQLGTWRRFYKQNDIVEAEEDWTESNLRFTKIQSIDIFYKITDLGNNKIKIKSWIEEPKEEDNSEKE
ncbi:hypothetical protein [Treponema sp.]|uniref:hypothetical protein n=1 Tax=Treponema sp. TaxID=166 RepID=UPI00388D21FC